MSRELLTRIRLNYAAWLGSMIERHQAGRKMLPFHRGHEAVEAEVDAWRVHGPPWWTDPSLEAWEPSFEPALSELVTRVIGYAQGWSKRNRFIIEVLAALPGTPPTELSHRLIDEGDADVLMMLAHKAHEDAVQWRLVGIDEAATTLAYRRFVYAKYSSEQFEEVLGQLLEHALGTFDTLVRTTPSEPAKADVLARAILASSAREFYRARQKLQYSDEVRRGLSAAGAWRT